MALASCACSLFRETDHEFVQSNECEAMGPDKNPRRLFMRCVLGHGHSGPHEIHLREDIEPTYWWDTESQKETEE